MNTLRYIYLIDHNNSVHANLRNMIFFFYRNDSQRQQQSQFVQWLHRHSNIVPIILYTLLLIFVGLLSSKRFWKRFQQIYEETFDKLGWTDHSVLQYCCGQSLQQQVAYRKNELVNIIVDFGHVYKTKYLWLPLFSKQLCRLQKLFLLFTYFPCDIY